MALVYACELSASSLHASVVVQFQLWVAKALLAWIRLKTWRPVLVSNALLTLQ